MVTERQEIESIANEVIRRIKSKLEKAQRHALVVCTGSTIALPIWIDELRELKQKGFTFDLFLSYNADKIFDKKMLEEKIGFNKIWSCSTDKMPEELANEYFTLIVPAMTITTASKVSRCIGDTEATRIILTALMRGKNVVIVTDGCCPECRERAEKGYIMTEPMKDVLRENIRTLKGFGATLSDANMLAKRTITTISFTPKNVVKDNRLRINKKIITFQDLSGLPNGTAVEISKSSQITQLAADIIRQRGIKIVRN